MNTFELLDQKGKITIPSIQRDYAYGRESEESIAKGLVNSVFKVLKGESDNLRLNYIYGVPKKVENEDQIILIDGQQRTTTLFLIGLYLCANADDTSIKQKFKSDRFSYETRTTTKDFCAFLSNESGTVLKCDGKPVKDKIINDKNFYKKWLNDPTIYSMLTVLEIIDNRCKKENRDFNKWLSNLQNVTFEYISLDSFKREESLYSTMNGRGKQLTEFEQIKSDIFELFRNLYPNIEDTVNNKWIPAFWDYAQKIKPKDDQYAADHHDRFLFNYFKYVVTMTYWENNEVTKSKETPNLKEIIEWLKTLSNNENAEATLGVIYFAMNSFSEFIRFEFDNYLAKKVIHDPKDPLKVNIWGKNDGKDDNASFDLIGKCCGVNNDSLSLFERCLLWTYIIFISKYKNTTDKDDVLRNYFVLIRDIYASSWDSNTPTGIDNSPKEYQVATGIMAFRQIVDNKEKLSNDRYQNQRNAFDSNNEEKYRILNNRCTRGCSNNIADVVSQNSIIKEHARTFAENIDFLMNNSTNEDNSIRFKNLLAFESIGIEPYFICDNNKQDRLYLPFNQKMLQSFFSMGDWKVSKYYKTIIEKLTKEELKDQENKHMPSDWQFYISKYSDCFMYEESFCGFDFIFDKTKAGIPEFFSMIGVYGTRASAKQKVSPYILAAYLKVQNKEISKKIIEECIKETEKMSIQENDGIIKVKDGEKEVSWDKQKDFVDFIIKEFFESGSKNPETN